MEQIDALYDLLNETVEVYESAIKLEYEKYDAAVKDDVDKLDDIISKEQVIYLKMKGIEQKRKKLILCMNMEDKTVNEIIEIVDNDDDKIKLKSIYNRLNKTLMDFKKINSECKTIIEIRLHRINNVMNKSGQKENTYSSESKQENLKHHVISKKI